MKDIKLFFKGILYKILKVICKITIWRFNPLIVAVTGSAGKTSAKEAIGTVLRNKGKVRKSYGNFNNELGVPLAILGNYKRIWKPASLFWIFVIFFGILRLFMPRRLYPDILVLEYGADRSGDIVKLVGLAKPDIGVITSVGDIPVHVEFYPSGVGAVIKEKSKLISNLSVKDYAILNFDDKNTYLMKDKTRAKVVGFGFTGKADYRISNFSHIIEGNKILGINFKIEKDGAMIPISIRSAFSVGNAYASATAIAVASEMKMNIIEAANELSNRYIPVQGRSTILKGIKNTQIIDESYNSSPIALILALITMSNIDFARRVGILGDMTELGGFTQKAHEKIGSIVPNSLDILITIGLRAKFISKSAIKAGMRDEYIFSYDTVDDAMKDIKNIIKKEDIILIKGSRVVGLDKIVDGLREI